MLRRVITALADAANWLPAARPSATVAVVADLGRASAAAALDLSDRVRVTATTAAAVAVSALADLAATAHHTAATSATTVARNAFGWAAPAPEVVQIVYSLTHREGGNETFLHGTEQWSNQNNAMGRRNGTFATSAGEIAAARLRHLELRFADFPNKDALTIESVKLHFYVARNGAAGGSLQFYRSGASVHLESFGGNVNFLAVPKTYDVTAAFPTWASLNGLSASVLHSAALGNSTDIVSFDAIEVEITATRTDTL